jgi:predicted nucleotidyltransferase
VSPEEVAEAVRATVLRDFPAVDALLLHGSRARGDHRSDSDWDLGVLTTGDTDLAALVTLLVDTLGTEAVDVVDLGRASALLRFRAARDGLALVERTPGVVERFRIDATIYWCDAGPIIRAAQAGLLDDLRAGDR